MSKAVAELEAEIRSLNSDEKTGLIRAQRWELRSTLISASMPSDASRRGSYASKPTPWVLAFENRPLTVAFADAARNHPEFAAELPRFLTAIYRVFNQSEIGYVATRKPKARKAAAAT
jgi:hypothetical protein